MSNEGLFPSLEGFEPTRQTLQLYSRVVGAVPRAHGEFHPKWWHISLRVGDHGQLTTLPIKLPDGGRLTVEMDFQQHDVILNAGDGRSRRWSMVDGLTASELAGNLLPAVDALGLSGEYNRAKFENDEPREYDPALATRFAQAIFHADRIIKAHRETLDGEKGPIQLWPHGFDLAFEWFGTRVQRYEEHGEVQEYPSQLNLGFSPGHPGQSAYFYSNPWPFEAEYLADKPLPEPAQWHLDGWQGTILSYDDLVGRPDAEAALRGYARAVFVLASPTLLKGWEEGVAAS